MTDRQSAGNTGRPAGSRASRAVRLRALPHGIALAALLTLVACDSDPLAIFDEDPPAPETAEQAEARTRSGSAVASDADAETPDLRTVPDRPAPASTPSTREKVIEGLVADRANARYTDEAIRLQGTGRETARPSGTTSEPASGRATEVAEAAAPSQASPEPASVTAPPPAPTPPAAPPAPSADTGSGGAVAAAAAGGAAIAASAQSTAAAPQVAAAPPAPRPASPVPPPPAIATPQNAPPPAPVVAAAAATTVSSASAPTMTASGGAVIVDTSALDSYGAPIGDPLARATGGEQVATIQFAHSSSRLDDRDRAILQQVAAIQRQAGGNIVVVGHASSRTQQLDKVEHEIANLNISMARANAVADALVASGVQRELVVVEAVSDGDPMFAESMPTGEAGNRRAEIYLVR